MDTVAPAVTGTPRVLLRIEGAFIFAIAIVLYARLGETWWLFAILFLAPDLSFLAYLAGARVGAIAYNTVHTLAGPILLALAGCSCHTSRPRRSRSYGSPIAALTARSATA